MPSIPNRIWKERQELYESKGIKSVWYLGFNPKWATENLFPLGSKGDWESTDHGEFCDQYTRVDAKVRIIITSQGWETVNIAQTFPLAVSLLPFLLATSLTKLPHLTVGSILLSLRYKTNQLSIQRDNL